MNKLERDLGGRPLAMVPAARRRRFKPLAILAVLGLLALAYLVAAGSVTKRVNAQDLAAIRTLDLGEGCRNLASFEDQLRCIRLVQLRVQGSVSDMRCADTSIIEPSDFLARNYGCCFDRARFIEKTLQHHGLTVRRVALHDQSKYGALAYLVPGVQSHASTEVLTERGWMGVDSNEPFLLLTRSGQPLTYETLRQTPRNELAFPVAPQAFFDLPYRVTYGLYSRHGRFHGPQLPAPELHLGDFWRYNVLGRH